MLVAGRTTGHVKNFRPYFFSLNPDLVPLPACLMGSKSDIDRFHRHRSPLILGQGMWGATFHVKAYKLNFQFQMENHSCVVELKMTENVTAMRELNK